MANDKLVQRGSTDVEALDFVEKGLIEMHATNSRRFSGEELKDDNR